MASDNCNARSLLKTALHKANNAVFFDYRQNFNDAIRAYGDACAILGQVKRVTLNEEDGAKLEAIVGSLAAGPQWRLMFDSELPTYDASTSCRNTLPNLCTSFNGLTSTFQLPYTSSEGHLNGWMVGWGAPQ